MTSRAPNDGGWVFSDVLVAIGILALALAFFFPGLRDGQRLLANREAALHQATEARADPWSEVR